MTLLLLFLLLPLQIHAFATYLLTNMGCMTDLSTTEVIMNSHVVAAVDSDHKHVHLKLLQEDSVVNTRQEMGDGSSKLFLMPSKEPLQLQLQLIAEGLADVQFVVEAEGASLEHGQCDQAKRVAARGKDTVTLQLPPSSSTGPVSVWAGWATGHEAVRLTPVLEFHREAPNQDALEEQQKEQVKEQLAEQLDKYKNDLDKVQKDAQKEKRSHHSNSDHRREPHHYQRRHKQQWLHSGSDSGDVVTGEVSSRARSSSRRKNQKSTSRQEHPRHHHHASSGGDPHHHHPATHDKQHRQPKHTWTQKLKNRFTKLQHNRQLLQPEHNKEPGIALDTTWFLYGLGILLVGTCIAIQCCRAVGGGGDASAKGRRTM